MFFVSLLLLKIVFLAFSGRSVFSSVSSRTVCIKNMRRKINTTQCTWNTGGINSYTGNVTMHKFAGISYNHGPHVYGVCTFRFRHKLNITKSLPVDIVGRHSLAIESSDSIYISTPLNLDWSPARNRSDMWLGGFCTRDNGMNKTSGNGPGGGACYGSAGHGGMGIDFERDENETQYGWRYASENSNIELIGGSSGGVLKHGSDFSCGGGAIMISSDKSVTLDSNISTNAFNVITNDSSCINGGSGGTIIIKSKQVYLTPNAQLVSRGALGNTKCGTGSHGSGGVIVINGTINGTTPDPRIHTSPYLKGSKGSNGVVLINGTSKNRLNSQPSSSPGYGGCYNRSTFNAFNYSVLPDYKIRPISCKTRCSDCGYRYAVLHEKLCACVDFLDHMNKVDEKKCSLRCFRSEMFRCGGQDGKNTYYVVYDAKINAFYNKSSNISTPTSCRRKPQTSHCNYPVRKSTISTTTGTILTTTRTILTTTSNKEPKALQDLAQIPVYKNNSKTILEEVSSIITAKDDLSPKELNLSLLIIEKIVQKDALSTKNKTESKRVGQLVLDIAENLLNCTATSWNVLKQTQSPELLLKYVEQAVTSLGESLEVNDSLNFNSSNFGLRIERVDPIQSEDRIFIFSGLDINEKETNTEYVEDEEVVVLPPSLPEAIQISTPFNIVLLKYRPHSIIINASLENSSARSVLASNIIAISVSPPLQKELRDKVVLNFPLRETGINDVKMSCRFLDFKEKLDISWSTRGCVVGKNEEGRTECLCNHFTNFAVLTDVHRVPPSKDHIEALNWLTYVGCTISLICLVSTLTTFAVLKTMISCDHIWIHCNLIASLILAQLVFIFGIKATKYQVVCKGIAISLQYLYTSAIFWMCIEGIHLYRKVVKVFTKSNVKKYYCIFGWGGPALMVCISTLLRFDGFGSDKACWLTTEKGLIWAFVAPVLCVVLINLIILLLVIRIMLVAVNAIQSNEQKSHNSSVRNGVKGVIFLLPILGLTWMFGVIAVNSTTVVFQYIFTIFNSFQGFFIFLFHCVLNKDVRAAMKKRQEKKTTIQRWSYESSAWKSKSSKHQKGSLQTSRISNPFVRKIDVKPSPKPPRSADTVE